MSVQKLQRNPETGKYEPVGEPEYVGCCLFTTADYNVRKMSDIWADDFYMVVWTGTGTKRVFTHSNFELQGPAADARVDATPEVKAAYAEWKAEQDRIAAERAETARKAEAERREKDCERMVKCPVVGSTVRVVKGRKVPVGTEGVVTWKGDDRYTGGTRIGIQDASGKVHYTNTDNAERIDVVKPESQTWSDFWYARQNNRPERGHMVRINVTGVTGKVFWQQATRIGVATTPNKCPDGRYADIEWVMAEQVTVLTDAEATTAEKAWEDKAGKVSKPAVKRTEIEVPF